MSSEVQISLVKAVQKLVILSGLAGALAFAVDEYGDYTRTEVIIAQIETAQSKNIPYRFEIGENQSSFETLPRQSPTETDDDCFIDFKEYRKTILDLREFDRNSPPIGLSGKPLNEFGFGSDVGVTKLVEKATVNDNAIVYLEKLEHESFGEFIAVLNSPGDGEATTIVKETEDVAALVGEVYAQYCF